MIWSIKCLGACSLVAVAAIFGFFYAWVCSTMWGLDAVDPRIAIPAMQSMNASVRNAVFAPAFFGTPVILVVASIVALAGGHRTFAFPVALAAVVYVLGAFWPTFAISVPMNEALARIAVPDTREAAGAIWTAYSPRWQFWNMVRTMCSGVAVLLVGAGLFRFGRSAALAA